MCTIGKKIHRLRIENNLSQPKLSKMLNISQSTLCNIESGDRKKIDFFLIEKICVVFNKNLNYFVEASTILGSEKAIDTIENIQAIERAISIIIDQFKILIKDNQNKLQIIQELENRLKSNN